MRPGARGLGRPGSEKPSPALEPHPPLLRPRAPRRGHRLTPADDELYQRTSISLLQRESPHTTYVDSYSSRGFTVNGNRVFGPCALLPSSVVQWNVSGAPRSEPRASRPTHSSPQNVGFFPGHGSLCLTSSCIESLVAQVGSHLDITEESFSLFWMLEPPIGI